MIEIIKLDKVALFLFSSISLAKAEPINEYSGFIVVGSVIIGLLVLVTVGTILCLEPPANPRGMVVERKASRKEKSKLVYSGDNNLLIGGDDEGEKFGVRDSAAPLPSEFEKVDVTSDANISVFSRGENMASLYEPNLITGVKGQKPAAANQNYPTLPKRKGEKKARVAASFMEV